LFRASSQLGTLQDFRFKRIYEARNGMHGSGANKTGRDGKDIIIKVPVGTLIKDTETGEILVDFIENGQEWVACKGGRGGKGNAHFVTSTHQAPKFAQPGEEGEIRQVTLELKLLADIGIIGYPNAGKSTLISRISAARPKIADYPFTTLTPNLGVVTVGDRSFVVADIPGLVEGAHWGRGLGHKFLKHIERTRIFVHLLDGAQLLEDATLPKKDAFEKAIQEFATRYQNIREELGLFNEDLLRKPEIVVLNKVDLLDSDPTLVAQACAALKEKISHLRNTTADPSLQAEEPLVISGVSGVGLENLLFVLARALAQDHRESGSTSSGSPILPDADPIRRSVRG
jgi:GTP-binding protein